MYTALRLCHSSIIQKAPCVHLSQHLIRETRYIYEWGHVTEAECDKYDQRNAHNIETSKTQLYVCLVTMYESR